MAEALLSVPQNLRRGARQKNQQAYVESGAELIALMCKEFDLPDLAAASLLDMGCGTKLAQALLSGSMPIKEYVGIDVYRDMIDYLVAEVHDQRFSFHHMNTHNAMYNTGGELLTGETPLPAAVARQHFDIICLFSVFTHLAPHDFVAMLKVLRPYINNRGRLIFSVFIHEQTAGGLGLIDVLKRDLQTRGKDVSDFALPPPDFVDANPAKPLTWAVYSRKHALELMAGTGWELESLNDPLPFIQHYFICKPV
jgi:SAM-dependent methyltransferase